MCGLLMAATQSLHGQPLHLSLPTDNTALLGGRHETFYMGVRRQGNLMWQGGTFGFVRSPLATPHGTVFTQFHEGIDIAPIKRDAGGLPLDVVGAIDAGTVVLCDTSGRSRYGLQVILRHDWPEGSIFSRYAHLRSIDVQAGQRVERGERLGVLGNTGGGLEMERAHLHLEINLMLNEGCDRSWLPGHVQDNMNPKFHPANFAGIDPAALFTASKLQPSLSFAEFVKRQEVYFVVNAATVGPIDLLRRHPWLGDSTQAISRGCRISFTRWGLPVKFEALDEGPTEPQVSWVRASADKHAWHTARILSGEGEVASLDTAGKALLKFLLGPEGH